jgi:hypothetical protein
MSAFVATIELEFPTRVIDATNDRLVVLLTYSTGSHSTSYNVPHGSYTASVLASVLTDLLKTFGGPPIGGGAAPGITSITFDAVASRFTVRRSAGLWYTGLQILFGTANSVLPVLGWTANAGRSYTSPNETNNTEIADLGPVVASDFVDVTPDLREDSGLDLDYGFSSSSPTDRVAKAGTLAFNLDNSEENSAGLLGFYSPNHANKRDGFGLGMLARLKQVYLGVPKYRFLGTVYSIKPTPGLAGKSTECMAVDWIDEAARTRVDPSIVLQVAKRSDEVFSTVVAGMRRQPGSISVSPGRDVFGYALNDSSQSVLSELQRIAMSEQALIYVRGDSIGGGQLVFEPRHSRLVQPAAVVSLGDAELLEMDAALLRTDVLNRIKVTVHPRRADTEPVTLCHLTAPIEVQQGQTLWLTMDYVDPLQKEAKIGGTREVNGVEAPTPEYTTLGGTMNVSVLYGANAATIILENTDASLPSNLMTLDIFGFGIYDYEAVEAMLENVPSQWLYGENELSIDMTYQSDAQVAQAVAVGIMDLLDDPVMRPASVSFKGHASAALMAAAMQLEISDRVSISESTTGIDGEFHINGVRLHYRSNDLVDCTFLLAPADPTTYFLIGTSTLGSSDVLAEA